MTKALPMVFIVIGHAGRFLAAILLMATSEVSLLPCWVSAAGAPPLSPSGRSEAGPEPEAERSKKSEQGDTVIGSLGREVIKDAEYILTSPLRLDAKSAVALGGVAAAIGGLTLVDRNIQRLSQRNRDDTSDDLAASLETLGFGRNVLIGNVGLIGAGWLFRNREAGNKLMQTSLISLEAQMFAEGLTGLTKFAVGRDRPSEGRGSDSFKPFNDFNRSFPSSHAARTFAVATVFADRYEQPVPFLAYTAATLVSLSRIHLNAHFASDVFAGAALGFALGKALSWRHREDKSGLAFLPFMPESGSGIGVTIHYSFR